MNLIKEVYIYRTMFANLVKKDLVTRYKGSFLGFLWTFVNPFLQLIIYSVVFSIIMRVNVENYNLYLFVAFIPWFFVSTSILSGSNCILSNSNIIQKIYFPRVIIPLSTVTSAFINMMLSLIIVFSALIFSGIGIGWQILYLPLIMLIQYFFVMGIVLICSAITVYFRDLQHILEIFIMAWFYITPIVYTPDMVPENLFWILKTNPMTGIINSYRAVLFYKEVPQFQELFLSLIFSIISLGIGIFVFQKLQRGFAEEL